jgi:hypothetical protein
MPPTPLVPPPNSTVDGEVHANHMMNLTIFKKKEKRKFKE